MIGIAGAGTMGSLIAALGCVAGEDVLLWDVDAAGLERGVERGREELRGGAERGRWPAGLEERLQAASAESDLARCEVVIEAIVERVEPKRELFTRLSENVVARPPTKAVVLARPYRDSLQHC